jgi:hypothetical protein
MGRKKRERGERERGKEGHKETSVSIFNLAKSYWTIGTGGRTVTQNRMQNKRI